MKFLYIRTGIFRDKTFKYWEKDGEYYTMMEGYADEVAMREKYLHGGTFLDVGACIGSWTIPAILMGAKVIAIEPNDNYKQLLECNLWLNNMKAEILNIAAWNSDGPIPYDGWFSNKGDKMIEGRTIDNLGLPHIDFIKIDVEHAEIQVLEGAQALINRDKAHVLVECHTDEILKHILSTYGGEIVDGTMPVGGHIYID